MWIMIVCCLRSIHLLRCGRCSLTGNAGELDLRSPGVDLLYILDVFRVEGGGRCVVPVHLQLYVPRNIKNDHIAGTPV